MSEIKKKTSLTLHNWLTRIRFLVMEGTNNKLFRTKESLGVIGEEKVEKHEELMFRHWQLPILIWSGP